MGLVLGTDCPSIYSYEWFQSRGFHKDEINRHNLVRKDETLVSHEVSCQEVGDDRAGRSRVIGIYISDLELDKRSWIATGLGS